MTKKNTDIIAEILETGIIGISALSPNYGFNPPGISKEVENIGCLLLNTGYWHFAICPYFDYSEYDKAILAKVVFQLKNHGFKEYKFQ